MMSRSVVRVVIIDGTASAHVHDPRRRQIVHRRVFARYRRDETVQVICRTQQHNDHEQKTRLFILPEPMTNYFCIGRHPGSGGLPPRSLWPSTENVAN